MKKSNVNKVLATAVMAGVFAPGMATVVANAQTPQEVEATLISTDVTEVAPETSTDVSKEVTTESKGLYFTDAQKEYIQAQIDLENNTRQALIQEGVATGNWQGYKSFEAIKNPKLYTVVEGQYVENKNYYAEKLTSALSAIQDAETEEIKESWEKAFQDALEDFRNAPTKDGEVPNVIGVNDTEELAKENNVPEPSVDEDFETEETVFTEEQKDYINGLIDLENDTRQNLIQDAIESGDWNEHKSFEALHNPAWYSVTEDGKYVENKVYYVQSLESTLRAINKAETEEDKAIWTKELEDTLEKFRNAHAPEGIVPYVVGINNNEAIAKEYNVPVVSDEYFDSKYNFPTVASQGKFKDEADNHILKLDVIKNTETGDAVEGEDSDNTKSVVIDHSKLVEVTPVEDEVLDVDPSDGFSDEEKALIQGKIDLKNNTREALILDAISSGDWNDYYAFQAIENPAWFMVSEDGIYVHNKFYYASQLESTVRAINSADSEETKAIWEKSLQETLEQFRNAPTPDGIIPYVVGVNHNEVLAKENNVPEASDSYFDSKYNSPTVLADGKFAK